MSIEEIGKYLYIDRNGALDRKTLTELTERFFALAREFGIYKGTADEGSYSCVTCDNPEWTALKSLFIDNIRHQLDCELMFMQIPDDVYFKKEEPL